MIANKKKYCCTSVYAPTNDSTVKDLDKTRTFYEKFSDIFAKNDRNTLLSSKETSMLRQESVININFSTTSSGITQKETSTKTEKSLLNSAVYTTFALRMPSLSINLYTRQHGRRQLNIKTLSTQKANSQDVTLTET